MTKTRAQKLASSSAGPAYQQIAADIRARIQTGRWKIGAMLPSRKDLARDYGVSVPTIERAMSDLLEDGTLRADTGRGTFVDRRGVRELRGEVPAILQDGFDGRPVRTNSPEYSTVPGEEHCVEPDIMPQFAPWTSSKPALPSRRTLSGPQMRIGIISQYLTGEIGYLSHTAVGIVGAIERIADRNGGASLFVGVRGGTDAGTRIRQAVDAMTARGATSIAITGFHEEHLAGDAMRSLMQTGLPVVMAGIEDIRLPIRHIYYDIRHSALQAASHLVEQGCTDLIYCGPINGGWVSDRMEGVHDAAVSFGLGSENVHYQIGTPAFSDKLKQTDLGRIAAAPLLDKLKPQTGIVACNDAVALGIMQAAASAGLSAGVDYRIIGFDGIQESRAAGLSTVPAPLEEMGREVVNMLDAMASGSCGAERLSVHSSVIMRQSTWLPVSEWTDTSERG